ncbi:MAG: D-alanine--D-alanine ligase [Clostridia bacterium]|nr:D-alanine--D-alanine ligase [Clostridia bacterium]MDE7328399.1 D-alanine--D-alanine ligase [Clostridia bacterium]
MKNLAVFYGGNSCEKDISIITALQAMDAADKTKYKIYPIYFTDCFILPDEYNKVETYAKATPPNGKRLVLNGRELYAVKKSKLKKLADIDCALLCAHGGCGENGALQGFLEIHNIPYTSPGVLASAVGMDKAVCKMICRRLSLPVLPYGTIYEGESESALAKIVARIGFPMIVKPAKQGSSIGISICKDDAELEENLKVAFNYDKKVVIEKALTNFKEINCACVKIKDKIYPSTLEEPVGWQDFLTFEDKYMSNCGKITKASAKRIYPAKLSENDTAKIQFMTSKLYSALECKGIVRCDFLLDSDSGEVYLNEINTVPGSLAGYLYEDRDIKLKDIIDIVVDEAIKDARENKSFVYSSKVLQYYAKNNANACKTSLKTV